MTPVPHFLPPLPVYPPFILAPQFYLQAPEDILTEDGLRIEVLATSVTCDRRIEAGDLVTIHYVGKLLATGEVFESSDAVGEPLKFVIGEKIFINFENLF